MRKILILLLGATLILSLVGCTSKNSGNRLSDTSKTANINNKQPKTDEPTVNNTDIKNTEEKFTLDRDTQKQLNIFLTAFTNSFSCLNFDIDNYDEKSLITFAVSNILRSNNYSYDKNTTNDNFAFTEKCIEDKIFEYFGINNIKHQSADQHTIYKDDHYEFPLCCGEPRPFAQLTKVTQLDNGNLQILADEYFPKEDYDMVPVADSDPLLDPIEFWNEYQKNSLEVTGKITAEVKIVKDDKTHYNLIKYSLKCNE